MPTMLIRKISGADAPARLTIKPVVKNRLKAGATWARPGMMTPNRLSWLRSQALGASEDWVTAIASPFHAVGRNRGTSG